MTPTIIGIYAPAQGSGKSTLARLLADKTNGRVESFAATLKAMAMLFLEDWLGNRAEAYRRVYGGDADKAEPIPGLGMSSRRFQQLLGTEFGRELVADDVWVEMGRRKAARNAENGYSTIFDDERFENEMAAIQADGGVSVRLVRPGTADTTGHASEGRLEGVEHDFEIANDGGLSELVDEAGRVAAALRKRGRDAA